MATTAQQAKPGVLYRPTRNASKGTWYTVPRDPKRIVQRLQRKHSLTCSQVAVLLRLQSGGVLAYRHVRRRLSASDSLYERKQLVALPAEAKLRAVKTRPAP
jgi:hypothetical protein